MKRIVSFLMLLPIMVGVSVFTTSCSDDDQHIAFDIVTPDGTPADAPAGVKGAVKFSAINDPVTPQARVLNILTVMDFTLEFEDAEADRWYTVTFPTEGNNLEKGTLTVTANDYPGLANPDRSAVITVVAKDGREIKFMIIQKHDDGTFVPANPDAEFLRGNYSAKGSPVTTGSPTEWNTKVYQMRKGGALTEEIAIALWGASSYNIFIAYIQLEFDDRGVMTPWIRTRKFPAFNNTNTLVGAIDIRSNPYGKIDVRGSWDAATKTLKFPGNPAINYAAYGLIGADANWQPDGGLYSDFYISFELKLISQDDTFIADQEDDGIAVIPSPPAGVSVSKAPQMELRLYEIMK